MRPIRLLLRLLSSTLIALALSAHAAGGPVRPITTLGELQGNDRGNGVETYFALSFALPPAGVRRWRPPEPPAP